MSTIRPGSWGPYSEQRYLRLQITWLKNDLEEKPMGIRTRKQVEAELRDLQAKLKKLNAQIKVMKMAKIQDSARALMQAE
jgi:hypothetical protein